jgi:hypothetical protein
VTRIALDQSVQGEWREIVYMLSQAHSVKLQSLSGFTSTKPSNFPNPPQSNRSSPLRLTLTFVTSNPSPIILLHLLVSASIPTNIRPIDNSFQSFFLQ